MPIDLELVLKRIAASRPDRPPAISVNGKPPSAVLVPFAEGSSGPELVLTRRAWHMRSHSGEVSFPGGRAEPGDPDLLSTALRESREEIGLPAENVEVIGELDRLTTVSSPSLIVPYVGLIHGTPVLRAEPDEVDGILRVPLAELADPSIFREEIWERDGMSMPVYFFELEGDTLWGATAKMVYNLLEVLTQPHP